MGTVFVFVPDSLESRKVGFLEGFSKQFDDNLTFYITNAKLVSRTSQIIGSCSAVTPNNNNVTCKNSEWIHIDNQSGKITVQNTTKPVENVTCILYNLAKFKKCDGSSFTSQEYGAHFETLCEALHTRPRGKSSSSPTLDWILKVFQKLNFLFKYSSTAAHFEHSIITMKQLLEEEERKTSLRIRNIIASKIFDVLIGAVSLYFILKHERQIFLYTNKLIETIIHSLRDLLDILMGSPIGLKLNHAFNMTLGIFFFYHISLWRVFIQFTRPLLRSTLYFLLVPATLGLSFQVAIFEDLVKFCTFHVYCIYVYAARLYGLQIHALISLWRLFIGHKYNPLRERVDSYQYSHHQLFIGTLGFTILLFLLPTTLLYYVVFTSFRLGLKLLSFILVCARVLLERLPLYVVVLWMFNSPSIAGTVVLKMTVEERSQALTLHVSLKALPLWTSIKTICPKVALPSPEVSCSKVLHTLFIGTLL